MKIHRSPRREWREDMAYVIVEDDMNAPWRDAVRALRLELGRIPTTRELAPVVVAARPDMSDVWARYVARDA